MGMRIYGENRNEIKKKSFSLNMKIYINLYFKYENEDNETYIRSPCGF